MKSLKKDDVNSVEHLSLMLLIYAISNNISRYHYVRQITIIRASSLSGRIDGARELLFYMPNDLGTKLINVIKLKLK